MRTIFALGVMNYVASLGNPANEGIAFLFVLAVALCFAQDIHSLLSNTPTP